MYRQDLHIHTIYSRGDRAVVPEQTLEMVDWLRHAKTIGISDHFEYLMGKRYSVYADHVKRFGFFCGTEVDGYKEALKAVEYNFDYYIYHCFDRRKDYEGATVLLETGKPVIIAHPYALGTDLNRVPPKCYIEINNRYIWRYNWKKELKPYIQKFKFILSSDAHQPNWLNQDISIKVAKELGIEETIIFA